MKSKWHASLVDSMVSHCERVLTARGVTNVDVIELPGTLEMPVAAKWLVTRESAKVDAVVCLSVVEKGSTAHFDMIIHSTTQTLMNLSVASGVPIINEIIAVMDIQDAIDRASDNENNKGIEAAAAALEIMGLQRRLAKS